MRIGETAMIIDPPPFHDFFNINPILSIPSQMNAWGSISEQHRKRECFRTVPLRHSGPPKASATPARPIERIIPIQIEEVSSSSSCGKSYDRHVIGNTNNSGTNNSNRERRKYGIEHELNRKTVSADQEEKRSRAYIIEHELQMRATSSTDNEKRSRRYVIEHELEQTRPERTTKDFTRNISIQKNLSEIEEQEDDVQITGFSKPREEDEYELGINGIIYRTNNHSPIPSTSGVRTKPIGCYGTRLNQSVGLYHGRTNQSGVLSDVAGPSSVSNDNKATPAITDTPSVKTTHAITPTPSYAVYKHLKPRLERDGRQIDYIRGDGNCFFRALSKDIYGSEEFHDDIRQAVVDLLEKYAKDFKQFLDSDVEIYDHIKAMRMASTWASTAEIYAAATLLQRDIYVLSPNHTGDLYNWLLFSPRFSYNQEMTYHPCHITLCHTHGNHYDRITQMSGGCNCDVDTPTLAGVKDYVDLTDD